MPPPPRRRVALAPALVAVAAAALVAVGCGDDGEEPPRRDATGCPVAVEYVAELLGYDVEVVDEGASERACRYEPVDATDRPGTHVLIVERTVADDGYDTVLSGVEAEATAVEVLDEGAVGDVIEGAERGWVAVLGRVVQVGAGTDGALFQVTVADAGRTSDEAREVAVALAAEAIR